MSTSRGHVSAFYKAYQEVDEFLSRRQSDARTTPRTYQVWSTRRSLNDQAYFMMIFAQLEEYINEQCRLLIQKKVSSASWKHKRLWQDLPVPDIHRYGFMKRIALLTEKECAVYKTVRDLYKDRCTVAHGGFVTSVNVPTVASTIFNLMGKLRG